MRYVNTSEVADRLNCTQKNIQRLIREKKLIPVNPYHSTGYLFTEDYINKIVEQKKSVDNG